MINPNRLPTVFFLLAVLGFHQIFAQNPEQTNQTDTNQKIDSIFRAFKGEVPGAVISVIRDGNVQTTKAYGMANLEYDVANTSSTQFHVASLSKQFTAFAILLLQDQGKLSLDDNVRKYIPELQDFGHTITLRHLASHTSGLRDQWNLLLLMGVRLDDVITNDHVVALIANQKELNFIPGEEFLYCNTGFSLLAEVVARVSGKSFSAFTSEYIFGPLQMHQTEFVDDFEKIYKNKAYSYYDRGNGNYYKRVLSFGTSGPSNLLTTAEDLGKWILNMENPKVGTPDIFLQMTTETPLNNGKTFGGGLGLFVGKRKGISEIQHGGADAGFRAHMSFFPAQKFGVLVLSNSGGSDTQSLAHQVADLYLSQDYREEKPAVSGIPEAKAIALPPGEMEKYVGSYWSKENAFSRRIYIKNDTLMHFRTLNNESPLMPTGPGEFKVMNVPVDARIRFELQNGEMTLTEKVNDGSPTLLRPFVPVEYKEADWLEFEGDFYSEELNTAYKIQWKNQKLQASHIRMGTIDLSLIKHNFFSGNRGFFGSVEFVRNEENKVTGFRVSNGRVRNLLFEKME